MIILIKIKQANLKQLYIPDHEYRILIIDGSGSGKTITLLNLISNRPDIDKMYLYAKDPYQAKYQHLIRKHNKVGLKLYDDPKVFIKYSNSKMKSWKET